MPIEFALEHQEASAKALFGALMGGSQGVRTCRCVDCVADRIADNPDPYAPASEAEVPLLVINAMRRTLDGVKEAREGVVSTAARILECPVRPEYDNTLLLGRIEQHNVLTKVFRELYALIPAGDRVELEKAGLELPEPLSWREALGRVETMRTEIAEAVRKRQVAKSLHVVVDESAAAIARELSAIQSAGLESKLPEPELADRMRNAISAARHAMRQTALGLSP